MFCEKCGSQITEGASFCERCGNQIISPEKHLKTPNKKKPLIISISIILVVTIVASIIVFSFASCGNNKSLAELLTAHKWVSGERDRFAIEFTNDGSFSCTYDGDYHTEWKGTWEIENVEQFTYLHLNDIMKSQKGSSWKKTNDNEDYFLAKEFSDADCEKAINGEINEETETNDISIKHSWYVSDKYFLIGGGFYWSWNIFTAE